MEHIAHDHADSMLLKEQLVKNEDFSAAAEVFKQLADPTRVRLYWVLCHCESCVTGLAELMDMSSPAVAHHLRSLRQSGLVEQRRQGKEVYYRAADTLAGKLLHDMLEQVMEISCPKNGDSHYIRQVHDYLMEDLSRRITTSELARMFHRNPTTLKEDFKAVYGMSIAAHMKEHRLEHASLLLRQTEDSVADIARAVGYESQSKFTAAFKEKYGVLPSALRKNG